MSWWVDLAIGLLYAALLGVMFMVLTHVGLLKEQVRLIWVFLIRRAKAETVIHAWGTMQSPIHIGPMAVEAILPLLDVIMPFYANLMTRNPPPTEVELFMEFEAHFGDLLVEKVCIPNKVSQGACVIAAVEVCKLKTQEQAGGGGS